MRTEQTAVGQTSLSGSGVPPLIWAKVRQPLPSMLLVATAVLFAGLGQGDIRVDGPIYAWIAKYMVQSGDWLNLYYDHGQTPYFNKPPLQFWLMALTFKVFGPTTFSAKLVSVLFGVACIVILYRLARLKFSREVAATTGIVLATTYPFIRNSAHVRLDAAVTFFFLLTLYIGMRMLRTRDHRLRDWLLLGLVCGCGLLIKSGVGLLCLPILAVAWAWQKRWDLLFNWRIGLAVVICAVIVVPWHWHQYATWGQTYLDQHFRQQVVGRLDADAFGSSPWYTYALELAKRYWPWLPCAAFGIWHFARRRRTEFSAEDRVLIVWLCLTAAVLHLIQRKYDRYLLLLFPVLAIFAAYGLSRMRMWDRWQLRMLPNAGWLTAAIVIALAVFRVPLHSTKYPELAQSISAINQAHVVYSFGPVGVSAECAIRFYTAAKVEPFRPRRAQAGDVLVFPRANETTLRLPPHTVIARGKTLVFARIDKVAAASRR